MSAVTTPKTPSQRVQKTVAAFVQMSGYVEPTLTEDAEEGEHFNCDAFSADLVLQNVDSDKSDSKRRIIVHSSNSDDARQVELRRNMRDNVQVTFEAAKIRLHEIYFGVHDLTADLKQREDAYKGALLSLESRQKDFLKKFDEIPISDATTMRRAGKSIVKSLLPTLAEFLQAEQDSVYRRLPPEDQAIYERFSKEQKEALYNAELDYLSDRARDIILVEYPDVPENEIEMGKPSGHYVQLAIPVSDTSTLDRRKYSDGKQQRPNFWCQINLHFDANDNVIDQEIIYRAAAPAFDDIKTEGERIAAAKQAILNDMQIFVFYRAIKLLSEGKPLSAEGFADMHIANLSLLSAVGAERRMIMEIQAAYQAVKQQVDTEGLKLSEELKQELKRMFPQDIEKVDAIQQEWLKPKAEMDNAGVNAARGGDNIYGTSSIEYQRRTAANADRIRLLLADVDKYIKNNPESKFAQKLKELKDIIPLAAKWDVHRNEYHRLLIGIASLARTPEEKKMHDTLAIFAMHMDLSAKPQINPLSPYNLVVAGQRIVSGRIGLRQNFIRQALALVLDEALANNNNNPDITELKDGSLKLNIGGKYNVIVHCKSGKDRTAVVLAYKQALKKALMEFREQHNGMINADLLNDQFISRVKTLFKHNIKHGIHLEITEQNCPGTFALLAQWTNFKGVFLPLVYDKATAVACGFKEQNSRARFSRHKWGKKIMAEKVGVNGPMAYTGDKDGPSRRSESQQLTVEEPTFHKRIKKLFAMLTPAPLKVTEPMQFSKSQDEHAARASVESSVSLPESRPTTPLPTTPPSPKDGPSPLKRG